MIKLIETSQRKPPKIDQDVSTFFGVDNPIPDDTISNAAINQRYREQHYSNLKNEIQKRDAELIKNRRMEHGKNMPVKMITMEERKMPRSKVGKFSSLADIQAAITMLGDSKFKQQKNMAVEIVLDDTDYQRLKKDGTDDPARSIVNMLKRKFENDGLPFKVYASDDKTITVMRSPEKK